MFLTKLIPWDDSIGEHLIPNDTIQEHVQGTKHSCPERRLHISVCMQEVIVKAFQSERIAL